MKTSNIIISVWAGVFIVAMALFLTLNIRAANLAWPVLEDITSRMDSVEVINITSNNQQFVVNHGDNFSSFQFTPTKDNIWISNDTLYIIPQARFFMNCPKSIEVIVDGEPYVVENYKP